MRRRCSRAQRAYNGAIFKLSEHSERLRKSAALLGFELPWTVEEIDAACNEVLKANGLTDAYMRPGRLARVGTDGRHAAGHQAAPRHRRLGMGQIFRRPRSPPRASASTSRRGAARRPTPRRCISKAAGLYMIASLSKQHADDRGYRRRADVRLARPGGRGDRRQRLLRHGRRALHADAGLLPRRHHPPDGDGPCPPARRRGVKNARSGRRSWKASSRCSSPAPRPK